MDSSEIRVWGGMGLVHSEKKKSTLLHLKAQSDDIHLVWKLCHENFIEIPYIFKKMNPE